MFEISNNPKKGSRLARLILDKVTVNFAQVNLSGPKRCPKLGSRSLQFYLNNTRSTPTNHFPFLAPLSALAFFCSNKF